MECGYALSSEEHLPLDLVRYARRAEDQEGFLSFYERDVLPAARELKASRAEAVHA
jgi:hypothetical protein